VNESGVASSGEIVFAETVDEVLAQALGKEKVAEFFAEGRPRVRCLLILVLDQGQVNQEDHLRSPVSGHSKFLLGDHQSSHSPLCHCFPNRSP